MDDQGAHNSLNRVQCSQLQLLYCVQGSVVFTVWIAWLRSRNVAFTVWIAWLRSRECGIHSLDCLVAFNGVWHSQFGLPGCVQDVAQFLSQHDVSGQLQLTSHERLVNKIRPPNKNAVHL